MTEVKAVLQGLCPSPVQSDLTSDTGTDAGAQGSPQLSPNGVRALACR